MNEVEEWLQPLIKAADVRGFLDEARRASWIPMCEADLTPQRWQESLEDHAWAVAEGYLAKGSDPGLVMSVSSFRLLGEIIRGRLGWDDYPPSPWRRLG